MKRRCASRACVVPGGRRPGRHHGWDLVKHVSDTLHTWRDRVRERRELARFTDRELRDVGLTWSDIALEVRKPFWRA